MFCHHQMGCRFLVTCFMSSRHRFYLALRLFFFARALGGAQIVKQRAPQLHEGAAYNTLNNPTGLPRFCAVAVGGF